MFKLRNSATSHSQRKESESLGNLMFVSRRHDLICLLLSLIHNMQREKTPNKREKKVKYTYDNQKKRKTRPKIRRKKNM